MITSLGDIVTILAVCSPLLGLLAGWIAGQWKSANKEAQAMKEGVKMLLRVKLIDKCLHYLGQKSIPPYALEIIKGLYSSYLALGDGDPSVGDLVEQVERLPISLGGG